MEDNAYIIGRIDLAQIALYAFWAFFFGLVAYLTREGMREGYPTISEVDGKPLSKAFIFPRPGPKTFLRRDGSTNTVPEMPDEYELKAIPTTAQTGAPVTPTGDPLVDGVGPAAWVNRPDVPDRNHAGDIRLRPMRFDNEFRIADLDYDPRGFDVVCCDGEVVGKVADVWIDRAEQLIRYVEVETSAGLKLVPMNLARIVGASERLQVRSVTAEQLRKAPTQKAEDEITLLEEDKVQAYFTGGTLYAHPSRTEPLI
ncbi:MAG: photosynthetic reaction center subunit H [Pseudomonadota bacterium]